MSADTLQLAAARSTPDQSGLFFLGDEAVNAGAGVTVGDGLRCAGGSVVRLDDRIADPSGAAASTLAIAAAAGNSAGDLKRHPWWHSDPLLPPRGAQFNLEPPGVDPGAVTGEASLRRRVRARSPRAMRGDR